MRYIRSKKLTDSAEGKPCVICGRVGTTVACHSNFGEHGKGGGIKASDIFSVRLCQLHHDQLDGRQGKLTRIELHELFALAHQRTIQAWIEEGLLTVG